MELIAVKCLNNEEARKVIEKFNITNNDDDWTAKEELFPVYIDLSDEHWSYDLEGIDFQGYTIQSADEYLAEGRDMEFKVGDSFFFKGNHGVTGIVTRRDKERIWFKYITSGRDCDLDNEYNTIVNNIVPLNEPEFTENKTTKNEVKEKESDMRRVRVILINREDDAVIFDGDLVTSSTNDEELKTQVTLDKCAEIKKAVKGTDISNLHWVFIPITEYAKPEDK